MSGRPYSWVFQGYDYRFTLDSYFSQLVSRQTLGLVRESYDACIINCLMDSSDHMYNATFSTPVSNWCNSSFNSTTLHLDIGRVFHHQYHFFFFCFIIFSILGSNEASNFSHNSFKGEFDRQLSLDSGIVSSTLKASSHISVPVTYSLGSSVNFSLSFIKDERRSHLLCTNRLAHGWQHLNHQAPKGV